MSNPFKHVDRVEVSISGSSLIDKIEWETTSKPTNPNPRGELYLSFVGGGHYKYSNVASSMLMDMLCAESIGKFFHENIREKYSTSTVDGKEE